jgi:hypothetical protein
LAKVATGIDKLELRVRAKDATPEINGLDAEGGFVLLENMKLRYKAFNAAIGFSSVRRQYSGQQRRSFLFLYYESAFTRENYKPRLLK